MTETAVLLVRASGLTCAIPLTGVRETMRALPCRALGGLPAYVLGASIIRGATTPVVDLAALLGAPESGARTRYVVLRGGSDIALAVDEVLGTRTLAERELDRIPRLLRDVGNQHIGSLVALDADVVPMLERTLVLDEEVLRRFAAASAEEGAP